MLAERGHDVTLFEANTCVGGQVSLAALSPRRRDLIGIIDWRLDECKRLGVKIRFNHYVEPGELDRSDYDVVILANGGVPDITWEATGRLGGGHLDIARARSNRPVRFWCTTTTAATRASTRSKH